jgi:hypothetical protein
MWGECWPCLRKVATWEELKNCNRVDDPSTSPNPNGCSVPPIICFVPDCDNPAGCSDTSFRGACDAHDICYQTCKSNKGTCDTDFRNAMLDVCMGSSCAYACSEFAYAYYSGVSGAEGQEAWEDDQVIACICCDCS